MTRLAAPRVRVVLDQPGGDALEVVVQSDNRDLVAWDMTRGRKGWPEMKDAPFLWSTFVAWSVMRREGHTDLSVDAFFERCLEAQVIKADDAENPDDGDTVGPTPQGLASA